MSADQGYAAKHVYQELERRAVCAYIPPQPTMLPPQGLERPLTEAEREALAARARCKTAEGIQAHKRRMADAEGIASEAKLEHALGRARCRGTPLVHIQLLLGCAAINLKRLATTLPEAAAGIAAATAAEAAAVTPGDANPSGRTARKSPTPHHASGAVWTVTLCLN